VSNMYELHPVTRDCANSAILISGSARSGTTIVGKLIHSFASIEYVFEPPALIALFSLMDILPRQQWDFLYQAYLYEEFLINAVSGRAINTNLADDSSIFAVKSEDEIMHRLKRSWPKVAASQVAANSRAAYKIPNIVSNIPELQIRYPGMSVIMMVRGALETIHSLLEKHVFTPGHPNSELPWPFRLIGSEKIPYWVRMGDEALWLELNEIDRCAYYYIRMNEGMAAAERKFVLKYTDLVRAPLNVAHQLAEFLDVEFGDKTESIIDTIKATGKKLDDGIIGLISDKFRKRVIEYSECLE
jgi:hypothetical protein